MRKNGIKLFILLFLSVVLLSGCSFVSQLMCEHEFEEQITKEATCTENGIKSIICKNCGFKKTEIIEHGNHNYVLDNKKDATCTEAGYEKYVCEYCLEEKIDILYPEHSFDDWETFGLNSNGDTILRRYCHNCSFYEENILIKYIDMTLVDAEYNKNQDYEANNEDELILLYSLALLYSDDEVKIKLKYVSSIGQSELDNLIDSLKNNSLYHTNYGVTVKCSSNILTFNFEYSMPSEKTNVDGFRQLGSANLIESTNKRSDDFDDFKINDITKTFNCETSEQLYYALEHQVKPIVKTGSKADSIYQEAKNVLREIINDEMNDYEKVKAIHDYLILNVSYDNELLNLAETGEEVGKYNGFYLEGVFEDGIAVCEGFSKAMTVLANIEGIRCISVSGNRKDNLDSIGHAWNKIYVGNNWYVIDSTSDNVIMSSRNCEILSYDYFLISDEIMEEVFQPSEYNDLECNNGYDVFENTVYDEGKTLKIENNDQLISALTYYKNKLDSVEDGVQLTISLEVLMSGNIVGNVREGLESVYSIPQEFGYISNGNVITIIK